MRGRTRRNIPQMREQFMKNEQSLDRSAMQATKAKKFPVCLRISVPVLSRNAILVPGFTLKGGNGQQ